MKETFGKAIGKATVTGYCIKFKALRDIDLDVLKAAIYAGLDSSIRPNRTPKESET